MVLMTTYLPLRRCGIIPALSLSMLLGLTCPSRAAINVSGNHTPTYNGTDDPWNVGGDLTVGNTALGTMEITDGSRVNSSAGTLGTTSGTTGEATVTGIGSFWNMSGDIRVGDLGIGKLEVVGGARVDNEVGYIAYERDSSGSATISGPGTFWDNNRNLVVGRFGTGSLELSKGARITNQFGLVGSGGFASAEAFITGVGTEWHSTFDFGVGTRGHGTVVIAGGALVRADGTVVIDEQIESNSSINIRDGGMLAIGGDFDDSLTQYLDQVGGTDVINYWDGNAWTHISNATPGTDFQLEHHTTGELAGFTVLTVGTVLEGDIDGNGIVDGLDFLLLQQGLGGVYTNANLADWENGYLAANGPSADFDGSGNVTGLDFLKWQIGDSTNPFSPSDLQLWEAQYGTTTANLAFVGAIPEPTAILLFSTAILLGGAAYRPRRCS